MKEKHTVLTNCFKIIPLEKHNDGFQLCKIYLQSVGKNRNHSYMSKENIVKNLPSISYAPVIGHLIPKLNDDGEIIGHYFGGHDYEFDIENMAFKPLTVPFGVIIEESWDFETIKELGEDKEYVTCLCYLWTERYPELKDAIYSDTLWFAQSMELKVGSWKIYEEDSNYTELVDWEYSAACILGKSDSREHPEWNTEPCFIESKIIPLQYAVDNKNFSKMMNEMKTRLAECFADISNKNKGGEKMTNEIRDSILSEYGLSVSDLNFDLTDDMTEAEFRAKLVEIYTEIGSADNSSNDNSEGDNNSDNDGNSSNAYSSTDNAENDADNVNNAEPGQAELFSLTYYEKLQKLSRLLGSFDVRDDEGLYITTHWLQDCDDNYIFVKIFERTEEKEGRFPYSVDADDNITIDKSKFEELFITRLTSEEKEVIEQMRADYSELKEYKIQRVNNDRKEEYEKVLSEFSDLLANEDFKSLTENAMSIDSVEALRKECFAIRGKTTPIATKPNTSGVRIPVGGLKSENTDRYGGFFERYLLNQK